MRKCGVAGLFGAAEIPGVRLEPGQQQLAQGLPPGRADLAELRQRTLAESPNATILPVAEQDQGFIEVHQRQPDAVLLAREQPPCALEQRERFAEVSLGARSDGHVGQRLGHFVIHPEVVEAGHRAFAEESGFLAQVQLEIHLRAVHVAQGAVIGVVQVVAFRLGRAVQVDGARVLAAHVVEVRDVVVRPEDQQRHAVLLAVLACLPVGLE